MFKCFILDVQFDGEQNNNTFASAFCSRTEKTNHLIHVHFPFHFSLLLQQTPLFFIAIIRLLYASYRLLSSGKVMYMDIFNTP